MASTTQSRSIERAIGAVVWLRLISSLAWLDSAFVGKDAKLSPVFLSGAGLAKAINEKFLHTALANSVVHFLQATVLPNAKLFAVLIALADLAIGISLLFGFLTRLGGAVAILRSITNILIAGGAGTDTVGFNGMLIAAGLIMIATRAGRYYGVDRSLIARWPNSRLLQLLA